MHGSDAARGEKRWLKRSVKVFFYNSILDSNSMYSLQAHCGPLVVKLDIFSKGQIRIYVAVTVAHLPRKADEITHHVPTQLRKSFACCRSRTVQDSIRNNDRGPLSLYVGIPYSLWLLPPPKAFRAYPRTAFLFFFPDFGLSKTKSGSQRKTA